MGYNYNDRNGEQEYLLLPILLGGATGRISCVVRNRCGKANG